MAVSEEDLQAFNSFAMQKLNNGGAETLQDLVDSWEIESITPQEHIENVSAVKAALKDMENGDAGRPAGEISKELRSELTQPE